jgi:cytochrome c oxidase subunit 4
MADSTQLEERESMQGRPDQGHAGAIDRHDAEHGHLPTSQQYVGIAVVLVMITIAEVAIYYLDINRLSLVIGLIVFMLIKFALVVAFFMHLRFDSRIFSTFFVGGLVVATAAFVAVLFMFRAL